MKTTILKNIFLFTIIIISITFCYALVAGDIVWTGDKNKNYVALTFDDGPKPGQSDKILNILDQYAVKATFFVIGREAKSSPDLVNRIVDSGHDIGNHTYSHYRLDGLSKEQISAEIIATNKIVEQITKKNVKFFRPPGGRYNTQVIKELKDNNLILIGWSVNPGDYVQGSKYFSPSLKKDDITKKVLDETKNGDIILLHNGGEATIEALPEIIIGLRAKGFELVTISRLIDDNIDIFRDVLP